MQHSSFIPGYEPTPAYRPNVAGRGLTALAGLTAVCLSMVTARGLLTHNWWFFVMLTWNLFLAIFPLGVALVLRDLRAAGFRQRGLLAVGLAGWLAFLPNAPYLITDLFHIRSVQEPLLWFDTMTLFLFALTGLTAGLYSSLVVHRLMRPLVGTGWAWGLLLVCQGLAGFGIYLGRFGRWNSWHVLTRPVALFDALLAARHDQLSINLTLAYGFVLAVLYSAFYHYVESGRLQRPA